MLTTDGTRIPWKVLLGGLARIVAAAFAFGIVTGFLLGLARFLMRHATHSH